MENINLKKGVNAYNSGNFTKAVELYKKSCDLENNWGCVFYSRLK